MDGPETLEAKAEDKGEPEEAAAEIEAGGRRKEIADEAFVKLRVWRPKGQNYRLMIVEIENKEVLAEKLRLFCFIKSMAGAYLLPFFCANRRDTIRITHVTLRFFHFSRLLLSCL